ncbi:MAG: hypothetical protein LBF90_04915 [Prevotellaceae bacterium]|jgi:hypothetical protein|nr:hypothetical protein [Prevotellaceae bacterium]
MRPLSLRRLSLIVLLGVAATAPAPAQTPGELHAALPAVAGWTIAPDVEVFNRDNLYERINGAAPLFFENNFEEMTSMVYTQGDDYITIQAYRHATPDDAFGMYASERSPEMTFFPDIGGEAQGDDYGLFFFAGSLYVKMAASNASEAIGRAFKEIAAGLARAMDADAAYPPLFKAFPKEGLLDHTQACIAQNYIGHAFLKPVYVADYHRQGLTFQAFVVVGETPDACRQILREYYRFAGRTDDPTPDANILIQDRYNGAVPLLWKGRYIVGAFNENAMDFPDDVFVFLHSFALHAE